MFWCSTVFPFRLPVRRWARILPSLLLLLTQIPAHPIQAQTAQPLSDLIGWQIPGLDNLAVEGVVTGEGYFTGNVPALGPGGGGTAPVIAGFSAPGADGFAVVVSFGAFTLSDYLTSIQGSGLEDLAFSELRLVIAPTGSGGNTAQPPAQVAQITGASIVLPTNPGVSGSLALRGNPAELMSSLGLGVSSLPVSGTIPMGLFTGAITAETVATALYPYLDLAIPAPEALLAAAQPPVPGATLDSLTLYVDGHSGEPAFTLIGGITLAGHSFGVSARELGGEAGPAIDITGEVSLGDLAGAHVPGLSELAVTSLRIEEGSFAGILTFRDVDFQVVVFETEGHGAPNVALMVPKLELSTFSPAFAGTPFNDIQLKPAGLILVPEGNGATQARLPTPVSDATGKEEMDLQPGLNMASRADASGVVGDLLDLLKVPKQGLHLGGTFDPAVFGDAVFSSGDAAALARQIEIDLNVPLGDISIPGAPDFFTSSGNILSLTNGPDGFAVSVMSDVTVHFDGSDPLNFTGTSITLGQEDGHEFAAISGHADIPWRSPFGISWINLHGLDLSAKFGTIKEFSIGSIADLGSVKGLEVTTSLTLNGSRIQEAGLALTGKDIPLNAIPIFSSFPSVDLVTLRDITVSNTAISGKAKAGSLPQVEAVLFESQKPQRGWNLAMMMSGLTLKEIIPSLPDLDPLNTILEEVKLDDLVLTLSEHGVLDDMATLPKAAQGTLTEIFGAASRVNVAGGLGLLGGLDPTTLSPQAQQALRTMGVGDQKLVLGGSIDGVFNTSPSFRLAAMLPAVTLPEDIQFLGLPSSLQGSFYFRFSSQTEPGFGVAVTTLSNMPTQNDPLPLQNDIYLEINPTGGVEVGVKSVTQGPWHEAFGIEGFDMLEGCELGVSISATSEVHMTAAGHAMVGTKEVEVTGAFGLIVGSGAPVPSRGSFSGQLSSMSLEDVMALTNAVATSGGGPPIKTDYPDVTLTDILIAFASPGETIEAKRVGSDETLTLTGPGIAMAGKLWMFFPDGPLGDFDGQIDPTGLKAKGAIHDFTLGGLTMTGNNLDIATSITDLTNPPHFKINGMADINGDEAELHMDAEVSTFTFSTAAALGGSDFSYDFGVYYEGPSSLTAEGLSSLDLGVDTEVEVTAIQEILMGPGADAAKKGLAEVTAATDSLTRAVDLAQTALNTVTDSVAKYRALAEQDQADRSQALTEATNRVSHARGLVDQLGRKADAAGRRIHSSCNQKKKTCVTLPWGKQCVKHPDPVKRTRCNAENAENYKDQKKYQGEQLLAQEALKRATDALNLIQDGNSAIPIDDDPRVAGWIDLRHTAQAALDGANEAVAGVEAATAAAHRALSVFQAGASAVKVTRAHMRGSLKEMLANQPLILDVDYEASGRQLSTRIPFNPMDMAYTANYLELLALQAAYVVSQNDPDASEAVKKAFRDQYLTKLTETETELDAVNDLNNVLPDGGSDEGGEE